MDYEILVNKDNLLDENYVPENLVLVDGPTGKKLDDSYVNKLNLMAYKYFLLMQKDALRKGYRIYVDSSYRSYQYQKELFDDLVLKKGYDYAIKYCAVPGASEHQTGLAIDIIFKRNGIMIEQQSWRDPEIIWMINNSFKYGYILRYPLGKERITGYNFEPWHYRFCTPDLARRLYNNSETLEEYHIRKRIK